MEQEKIELEFFKAALTGILASSPETMVIRDQNIVNRAARIAKLAAETYSQSKQVAAHE